MRDTLRSERRVSPILDLQVGWTFVTSEECCGESGYCNSTR